MKTPLAAVMVGWALGSSIALAQSIDFNRDIRPILAENCLACHGPDASTRAADLRLDLRDVAIQSGAIVPHDPTSSELVERINERDRDLVMPPPASHKRLSREQRQLLERWIAEGASYNEHWAWIVPQTPPSPKVPNETWVRNPIDRFVAAKLASLGLSPAEEADLNVLLRRVTLDLTGLPPDPNKIREVISDTRPDRYERYVDWLLEQPEWGEHRARFWLDYARYADTHGIHFDNYREMWAYRDWIIEAFNRNLRFDQFTIEQLAGDLLPAPSLDQQIATGFNRCNITTNEGGVIEDEYRVLYARDRVETTMLVWNGITLGCAVCHDHKYDPFTMRDFYQLAAFFNNSTQPVMDGNIKDTPPVVFVPRRSDRDEFSTVSAALRRVETELQTLSDSGRDRFLQEVSDRGDQFTTWLDSAKTEWPPLLLSWPAQSALQETSEEGTAWEPGYTSERAWKVAEAGQPRFAELADFERNQPYSVSLWIRPDTRDGAIIARMDERHAYRGWDVWLQGGYVAMHLIHRWPDNALKITATEQPLDKGRWYHVAVTYSGNSQPDGVRIYVDGRPLTTRIEQNSLSETTRADVPLSIGSRNRSSRIDGGLVEDIRIAPSVLEPNFIAKIAQNARAEFVLGKAVEGWTDDELASATKWYLFHHDAEYRALLDQQRTLVASRESLVSRGTVAHVMAERSDAATAHILARGEYDHRLELVHADTPAALPRMSESWPRNRLGLALWLLDERHPLTARVTVNRFWQEVFGRGIVATSGDFGTMGQLPDNQELLDYLALWFRDHQWDVKELFRLMVTSATYRQSAALTAEKLQADPDNAWLSRGPRFRMDGEAIRDATLAVTGVLYREIGGPSVKPYQPP
ncbi:MAG TPA: DUF1549 domain-containing protein, partial [Pirellulaceae bacterium]|nr:DUF1549 domain-containing protein [Pirellulaceae bacterium]